LIHILFQLRLKLSTTHRYAQGFKILFSIFPIFALLLILFLLPPSHKLWISIQAVGFTALGLFIVSIYQNRAKRFESD
jgi:positive regulator of sigma E activity